MKDTQTARQAQRTDRHTDRQTDRQTDGQIVQTDIQAGQEQLQTGRLADREEQLHLTITSDKACVKALNLQNAAAVLPTNEAAVAPPLACFI